MPASKRQRGATAIREEQGQLPQLNLPRIGFSLERLPNKHVLTAAALALCILVVIFLMPASETHRQRETRSQRSAEQRQLNRSLNSHPLKRLSNRQQS